jgi:ABC-type glycerol-3-phosphate transport system substrate-binding protein
MKLKHLYLILSVVVLVLSACTPATPVISPASASTGNIVTVIRVGTGDSGEGLNPHQQIIQQFEDKNPNILVQLEAVAGRDYYARLLTQLAAKAAPDLMQVGDDAVPALATVAIFTFQASWNDFLGPLIFLHDQSKYTLTLGLSFFRGAYEIKWAYLMAASLVIVLPVVLLYFFAQCAFVEGLAFSGLKL